MSGRVKGKTNGTAEQRLPAQQYGSVLVGGCAGSKQSSERQGSIASAGSLSTGRPAQAANHRQQFAAVLEAHFATAESKGQDELQAPANPKLSKGGSGRCRFRGVTRHKRTQRFESHIWEMKKQIYLGGFDSEALAAKAHDIMALRCKTGSAVEDAESVLNFPRHEYTPLLPLIDRLTREDVITALRNYSKLQTSRRTGHTARGPSPAPDSPAPTRTSGGGVRKVTSGQGLRARRLTTTTRASGGATAASAGAPCQLSISVRRESEPSQGSKGGSPRGCIPSRPPGSPRSFGAKVAPRRPRIIPPAAAGGDGCAELAAEVPAAGSAAKSSNAWRCAVAFQQHSGAASGSPRSPATAPASPTTPFGREGQGGAPVTPTGAAARPPAFVTTGAASGAQCMLGTVRAPSVAVAHLSPEAAAAPSILPAMQQAPPLGASAAATATVDAAHRQYLFELYCQQAASTHVQQQHPCQQKLLWQHQRQGFREQGQGEECASLAGATSGSGFVSASATPAWLAAQSTTQPVVAASEAALGHVQGAGATVVRQPSGLSCFDTAAAGDLAADMEVDARVELGATLEEPSLTFSASDDAYLFQPAAPADLCGCTAVEHVNGTMLFREEAPQPQQQPLPQHQQEAHTTVAQVAATGPALREKELEAVAAALLRTPSLAPPSAPWAALPPQQAAATGAFWGLQHPQSSLLNSCTPAVGGAVIGGATASQAASPFAAAAVVSRSCAGFGADGPVARPGSPGHLITVMPASSVPHPPATLSSAAHPTYPPQPASVAAVLAASAAALQQAGLHPRQHELLLQQHPSLFASLSPFSLYANSSSPLG